MFSQKFSKTVAKTGLLAVAGLFAVSCATEPKQERIQLVDGSETAQEQETINTYEKFPYIDFRGDRL